MWGYNAGGRAVRSGGDCVCQCGARHVLPWQRALKRFAPLTCHERALDSEEQRYAKVLLKEHVGKYTFDLVLCRACARPLKTLDTVEWSASVDIVQEAGRWRYVCRLRKGVKDITLDVGSPGLFEFAIKDVLRLQFGPTKLRNLAVKYGLCEQCALLPVRTIDTKIDDYVVSIYSQSQKDLEDEKPAEAPALPVVMAVVQRKIESEDLLQQDRLAKMYWEAENPEERKALIAQLQTLHTDCLP